MGSQDTHVQISTVPSSTKNLLKAREDERKWIAREIHDNVLQRLALLYMELDRWEKQAPESSRDTHVQIQSIRERLSEINHAVKVIAHDLHCSHLEYRGLVIAAQNLCKEMSERCGVKVLFSHRGVPRILPEEISVGLFRVMQEALQNAIKHSESRYLKVDLSGGPDEVELWVTDAGVGFDTEVASGGEGLGLISMKERIEAINGHLSIVSERGLGTSVHARVPLIIGSSPGQQMQLREQATDLNSD